MAEYFYLEVVIQFCTQNFFTDSNFEHISFFFKSFLRKCTSLEDRISDKGRLSKNREYFLIRFYKHTSLENP